MRNNIKYWGLCLFIAVGLASCESEEDDLKDRTSDLGGYALLTDRSLSRFDTNEELNIDLITSEGVTAETVEILQDGEVVGTATVSGESASFNSSILGNFTFPDDDGIDEEEGTYPVRIRTTYSNGNVSEDPFTISVGKVLSLGNAADEYDNPNQITMDSLSSVSLAYEVYSFSAPIDDVSLMLKKNEDGTYMPSGVELSTDGGYVELSETNYEELNLMVNDTLHYKFTATSGEMTDVIESTIAITPKAFTTSNSVTLTDDALTNQLNLATGEISEEGNEEGEIRFLDPTGFEVINDVDISFVEVESEFFEEADVLTAWEAFEAGDPETSFTDLESGDTFVYKTTREVEDEDGNVETYNYYGVLQISNVTTVDGEVVSYDVEYAEGY
ncbi:hypothetical protein RM549_02635 [Salegentibacter sp. F188]|uniref:Uncharacterized protein n=1 Tax=Autumnicola patrickiae TaxID=3075591 RepID=A0ABU3DYE2_9FLAO|nr:hypothetical protein [Salegentibacter sp. F188]MDT0688663.1 hypothetical protein [Salegentibacter sp. F188]